MQNEKPIDFGLRGCSKIKIPEVLDAVYQDTFQLLQQEKPEVVILEQPVHFKNANSVIALVGAYSMITLVVLHLGVNIAEIRPSELKM